MVKVLVTGGLGRIGAFICHALLATARQPIIYDLGTNTDLIPDIAKDCIIERGSTCDLPRIMSVIAQHRPTAVFHLAGQVEASVERFPWSSINVNLIGTTTVLEAVRLSGLQRMVFASSRQVYGPIAHQHRHPTYEPVPEEHQREPLILYGKLKRACEDVADHYAKLYALDIVALRFGSTYGPGRYGRNAKASPVRALIEAAIANLPCRIEFGGEQHDDLCYYGDCASAFIAALDSTPQHGKFRAYNISAGELISLREMAAILQDLQPGWRSDVGPGFDYRRLGAGFYFKLALAKARAELGFEPRFNFRNAAIDYGARLRMLNAR